MDKVIKNDERKKTKKKFSISVLYKINNCIGNCFINSFLNEIFIIFILDNTI